MTVKELIEKLSRVYDKDMDVMFAFPSGDYHGTVKCWDVSLVTDQQMTEWSNYHESYIWHAGEFDKRDVYKKFVVLSSYDYNDE